MPHAIRIDPDGNVWTTDAASSKVIKFTPDGRKLMEIAVGGQPVPCRNNFCGTTDIAFARNGHLFIADGYANARILEYTGDGQKVREWGTPGTGPGQFRLPHSIQIDEDGILYVADRENGRVQRFTQDGAYLGEWAAFGKTFGLKADAGTMWLATQQRNEPNLSPGWLLKIDRKSGAVLGYVEVTGVHGMDAMSNGELLVGPGPDAKAPQWFRRPRGALTVILVPGARVPSLNRHGLNAKLAHGVQSVNCPWPSFERVAPYASFSCRFEAATNALHCVSVKSVVPVNVSTSGSGACRLSSPRIFRSP